MDGVIEVAAAAQESFFFGSTVVITGAAGSIGRELLQHLLSAGAGLVRALDNNENGLFELHSIYRNEPRVDVAFCDVASLAQLQRLFMGADFVFHLAACKHVPVCERMPSAVTKVNIDGVANVVEAALYNRVKRLLFTSSDKAVYPTNVMGASKLLGERIAIDANRRNGTTLVTCTRFGNVLGSRGSVVPIFSDQIRAGGPVTVTSTEMTRFFMTIPSAVEMIVDAIIHSRGGEIFVPKMRAIRIEDLARVMICLLAPVGGFKPENIKTHIMGPRYGEKLYEDLITEEESAVALEVDKYIIVLPRHSSGFSAGGGSYSRLGIGAPVNRTYNSRVEKPASSVEIASLLCQAKLAPRHMAALVTPSVVAA